jgi:hypothetical protein
MLSSLGEERRRLEELQRKAKEAAEMKQNIHNLKHSTDEQRFRLHQQKGMTNGDTSLPNVRVGEADAGLQIKLKNPGPGSVNGDMNLPFHLTQHQFSYLALFQRQKYYVRVYQRTERTIKVSGSKRNNSKVEALS